MKFWINIWMIMNGFCGNNPNTISRTCYMGHCYLITKLLKNIQKH